MKSKSLKTLAVVVALAAVAASAFAAAVQPDALMAVALMLDPSAMLHHAGTILAAAPAALVAMQTEQKQVVASMRAISDKAAAENRDLTPEEDAEFQRLAQSNRSLKARIEREKFLADEDAGLAAATPPGRGAGAVVVAANASIEVHENLLDDPKLGFKSLGEFSNIVKQATYLGQQGRAPDERLQLIAAAPSTYGNESSGQDGGYLIPPEFAKQIFMLSQTEDSLLGATDNVTIDGNNMTFPRDETLPWGTNGVRAYWLNEAGAATLTKPVVGSETLRLKKLMAFVPVTDEMLADSTAMGSYLPSKIADSLRWKINEGILFGAGGGLPQGAFTSAAALTVAKESSQATATLQALNLAKMIAALPAGSYSRAIWLINNDVLPALFTMTLGNYPIYLPAGVGGLQGNPYGLLLGRPLVISQHAKSFSSAGDVLLVDLSYYQVITKASGIETASSMHLYFDAGVTAFRTTFRMDGQSKLSQQITPANGSNKLSPFVQLGAR